MAIICKMQLYCPPAFATKEKIEMIRSWIQQQSSFLRGVMLRVFQSWVPKDNRISRQNYKQQTKN